MDIRNWGGPVPPAIPFPDPFMRYFTTILFLFAGLVAIGQVRPKDFPEKTSATGSDHIYSQGDGSDKKILFSTAKRYFTPDVRPAAVGYVPNETGNTSNLMEFVKDTNGDIWFIDAGGDAFMLFDASGGGGGTDDQSALEVPVLPSIPGIGASNVHDALAEHQGDIEALSNMVDTVSLVSSIAAYTGTATVLLVLDGGGAGFFALSGQTVNDDNGVWVKDGSSRQFRRVFDGPIDPRWYGADGTDTFDDLPSIQNAVNAGGTNGLPNHVHLTAGSYLVEDDVVKLRDGMLFTGDGDSTVLYITASHDGANTSQENGILGAYGTAGARISNVTIRDLQIKGAEGVGGNMNGIMMAFCDSCTVENTLVNRPRNYGIWFKESYAGSIINNKVHGGTESIEVSQTCKNINVRGNFVKGLGNKTINCVLIYGDARNINVSENHIDGTAGNHGIFISASVNGCRDVVLTDNHVVVENSGAAIKWPVIFEKNSLDTLENFTVKGGFLKGDDACIRVNQSCTGINVNNVFMESDSTEAIRFIPGAGMSNITISNCNIICKDGIHLGDASNVIFKGNVIDTKDRGDFVGSNSAHNVSYLDNRLTGGYLNIASNCIVSGNGVDSSGLAYSLYVQGDSSRVENNRVEKRLQVSGDYNSITDNYVNSDQIMNDVGTNNLKFGNKSINTSDPDVADLTGITNPRILVQGDSDLYSVEATHFEGGGGGGWTKISLPDTVASVSTDWGDITGMGMSLVSGKEYMVKIYATYTSDNTSSGAKFGWESEPGITAGTVLNRQATGTASTSIVKSGNTQTFTPSPNTTSHATEGTVLYDLLIIPTSSGTFIPRFGSELGTGIIVVREAKLLWREI